MLKLEAKTLFKLNKPLVTQVLSKTLQKISRPVKYPALYEAGIKGLTTAIRDFHGINPVTFSEVAEVHIMKALYHELFKPDSSGPSHN